MVEKGEQLSNNLSAKQIRVLEELAKRHDLLRKLHKKMSTFENDEVENSGLAH
jgi:hypothetical protein